MINLLHDIFTQDLNLPLLIDVFVRVENQTELGLHQSLRIALLEIFVCNLDLSIGRHVLLVQVLEEHLVALFKLTLNICEVFLH